jgi:hypothetical protein
VLISRIGPRGFGISRLLGKIHAAGVSHTGNRDKRGREVKKPKKAKIKEAPPKSRYEPTPPKPAKTSTQPGAPETVPQS